MPLCTDLLSLGDFSVIRKDCYFTGYRARGGVIETGAVTLGRNALVAEASVLDIGTSLGDGARLAHASALHSGQAIPAEEHWHGSPARRADGEYPVVEAASCGPLRRSLHSVTQLLMALLVYLPLAVGASGCCSPRPRSCPRCWNRGGLLSSLRGCSTGMPCSFPSCCCSRSCRSALSSSPRFRGCSRACSSRAVYPLYGFHYGGVHRAVMLLTNRPFLTRLFGDSSAVVPYLRLLGYDLSRVQQTGSNFGTEVKHETPYLSAVGTGTMVADGLSVNNAEYSSTSFRVSRTAIGARNFLGNRIAYPSRGGGRETTASWRPRSWFR